MRLLQVSLRSLLLYSLVLVVISIPVSLFSIQEILNEEVDESLSLNSEQFLQHLKNFEYLDDLETDLHVLDQLSYNIHIKPTTQTIAKNSFETVKRYDSIEHEERPFRQLSSNIVVKGKPYLLTISMSLVDNDDLIIAIGIVQVILIVLLTGGLLFINRSLSKKLWTPFYKTISRLKAYELDKNEAFEVDKTNIIEFDDLNKAIGNLTERNRKVFLQQKEFIENASHELQTPLAIFQSKLDILMQSSALSESSAETISELEATAQRMSRLNKNLLLLSKIDNEQFIEKEDVDLQATTLDVIAKISDIADTNQLSMVNSIEAGRTLANKTLIEVLITNLLHNAVRHAPTGGSIHVTVKDKTFEVANSGKPLSDSERIFERFRKDSANSESTGLGLAIVKKICDLCSYELHYEYKADLHVFSVKFWP
jgi:signal transduction histidine kinase